MQAKVLNFPTFAEERNSLMMSFTWRGLTENLPKEVEILALLHGLFCAGQNLRHLNFAAEEDFVFVISWATNQREV